MNVHSSKRPVLLAVSVSALAFAGCAHAQVPPDAGATVALPVAAGDTLTFSQPQLAGICGLRVQWNEPVILSEDGATADQSPEDGRFGKSPTALWNSAKRGDKPGAAVFDAVHRSLLVRFPGAASQIAAKMASGKAVSKVELVLPFKGIELWPDGYNLPSALSFLGDAWIKDKPRWHAQAWALRKPWAADSKVGPTWNASVNGGAYWAKFGAQDTTQDRFPTAFGPAEVSEQNPQGRMDVTGMVNDAAYGKTPAERLSAIENNGFLIKKEEVYDISKWVGGYEWGSARGPQGIFVKTPQLVVTFADGAKTKAAPAKFDFASYAAKLQGAPQGKPTATVPTEAEYEKLRARYAFARPAWMTADWQWKHVQELNQLGGGNEFPQTYADYLKWLDNQLGLAPRTWNGFDSVEVTTDYFKYLDALPEPVRDNWRLYWTSWLQPDRPYQGFTAPNGQKYDFAHGFIGGKQAQQYLADTGDWRGNFSLYRTYSREMGTMNFNHWNTAGVLFGGQIIGSDAMVQQGRAGLENLPLRLWAWADGSTQESVDHYYFSLSLKAQKSFADHGPQVPDRMMGQAIVTKSVEELASNFHPGLRRFSASSSRTGVAYLLGIQDGLQHVMHTLSAAGAETDLGKKEITATNVEGMPPEGHDLLPGQVAEKTLEGSWAPTWFSEIIDNKTLPSQFTATYKHWGQYGDTPLWRRSYMGHNYDMASTDVTDMETIPFMTQWRRAPKTVESMTELGTLLIRGGYNRTDFLDSLLHGKQAGANQNGLIGNQGHHNFIFQDKNRAIVLASPTANLEGDESDRKVPDAVTSLQTSVALFNFEPKATWQLFADGKPVTTFPFKTKFGTKLTLHDGVSYVGLIPLPAANLGRDTEVEIVDDGVMTQMQGGGKVREALRINAYTYRSDKPLDKKRPDLTQAYGGYVVETADVNDYPSFEAFQKHINAAQLATKWDAAAKSLDVSYKTGADTLHCVYKPGVFSNNTTEIFPTREVNGKWPYLPKDLDRDSAVSQQGRVGTLAKNGAKLETEPGRMAYLISEPRSGHVLALNPFTDATMWRLTLPDGRVVSANGRLGMTRMDFDAKANTLGVAYGELRSPKTQFDLASALVVTGGAAPKMTLNGKDVAAQPVTLGGKTASAFALNDAFDAKTVDQGFDGAQKAFATIRTSGSQGTSPQIVDWWLLGPVPVAAPLPALEKSAAAPAISQPVSVAGKSLNWGTVPGAAYGNGAVNLGPRFGGTQAGAAYAYAWTTIVSDADQRVQLVTGANADLTVWVNGKQATQYTTGGTAYPDMNRSFAALQKGENQILTRTKAGNGWEFYLRFADIYGAPITNVKAQIPPAPQT